MKFGTSLKVLSGKYAFDLGKEFVFFPRSHKADGFQSVVTPLLALSAS